MSDSGRSTPGGRLVLLTGASTRIGLETARRLARAENRVILHARTAEEAEHALEHLVKAGTDPLRLQTVVADFDRLDEVRGLAGRVAREHPRLDVLINNAATLTMFTTAMAMYERGGPVTVAVHPGIVTTSLTGGTSRPAQPVRLKVFR